MKSKLFTYGLGICIAIPLVYFDSRGITWPMWAFFIVGVIVVPALAVIGQLAGFRRTRRATNDGSGTE